MENTVQDVIEKEVIINGSKERVFQAISDPAQITSWFPEGIEGSLAVGEKPVFDFGKHGKVQVVIIASEPSDYFAYRWIPGSNVHSEEEISETLDHPNTLVEFRLEDIEGKTKVTVKETGFASLPSETYEKILGENTKGWEFMLGRLEKFIN
ncbi:MAG: SRPBCC domain-containing protein [Candidatus Gracilibacteria bacterium]